MKRPVRPPPRRGAPIVHPWESLPSRRAGLPADRSAWLALVLPIFDRCRTHPQTAEELKSMGYTVTTKTLSLWHQRLTAMQAAGALPERTQALPERLPGWHAGAPLPSPERAAAGRARARRARGRKGGGKSGKSRTVSR